MEDATKTKTSLFPAFSSGLSQHLISIDSDTSDTKCELSWLHNPSFAEESLSKIKYSQDNISEDRISDEQNIDVTSKTAEGYDTTKRKPTKLKKAREESESELVGKHDTVVRSRREDNGRSRRNRSSDSDSSSDRSVSRRSKRGKTKKKHRHSHKKKKRKHGRTNGSDDEDKHHKKKKEKEDKEETRLPSGASKMVFLEEVGVQPEHAFRIDRQRDMNNLRCGSIYKAHVSRYWPTRAHRSLGMDDATRRLFALPATRPMRYCDRDVARAVRRERSLDLSRPASAARSPPDTAAGFIPVVASTARVPGVELPVAVASHLVPQLPVTAASHPGVGHPFAAASHPVTVASYPVPQLPVEEIPLPVDAIPLLGSSLRVLGDKDSLGIIDRATQAYVHGGVPTEVVDDEGAGIGVVEGVSDEVGRRVAKYNRRLREHPEDADAWLEFLSFQDELLRDAAAAGGGQRAPPRRAVLEKKMAIVEKALGAVPRAAAVPLHVAKLDIGAELWEKERLLKEWERFIFVHPNEARLWQEYLMFRQSHLKTFTFSATFAKYGKCLQTLNAIQERTFTSHQPLPHTPEYMLVRYYLPRHGLGTTRQHSPPVACFQALVEYNCFCPESLAHSVSSQALVAFFETFWDSGVSRIGEDDAPGWAQWMQNKSSGAPQEETPLPEEEDSSEEQDRLEDKIIGEQPPAWRAWTAIERLRESRNWLPWRPGGGRSVDDCEDPDRLVLFDDVSASLFRLDRETLRFELASHFLEFLGAHPEPLHASSSRQERRRRQVASTSPSDVLDVPDSAAVLVAPSSEALAGGAARIRNAFAQLLPRFAAPNLRSALTRAWLRFEVSAAGGVVGRSRAREARRRARELLRDDPACRNDVSLYALYARFEWSLGNRGDARRVFDTAVATVTRAHAGAQRQELGALYRTYAELELGIETGADGIGERAARAETGDREKATALLAALADGGHAGAPVSPTRTLKCQRWYASEVAVATTQHDPSGDFASSYVSDVVCCAGYFLYLTQGVVAACAHFDDIIAALRSECRDGDDDSLFDPGRDSARRHLEAVMASHVSLLTYHVRTSVAPLRRVREVLQVALVEFPDNTQLLQIFLKLEERSQIAGRLRRYFDHVCPKSNTIVPWVYAIYAELSRQKLKAVISDQDEPGMQGATYNRIRSLFERAVASKVCQHLILMWRMYMSFEILHGSQRSAQQLFYRAIAECPWAKVLYMDGIRYFPDEFEDITDLMVEKEVRMRAPTEEIELLLHNAAIEEEPSNAKEEAGNVGDEVSNAKDEADNVGEEASNVGEEASNVGEEAGNTDNAGEEASNVEEGASNMGEEAGNVGEKPSNAKEEAGNVGEEAGNVGEEAGNVGEEARKVGEEARNSEEEAGNVEEEAGNADNALEEANTAGHPREKANQC
ncbi:PREDICTED: protein NRDE2 homolog [Priapulus caudatus]|uniref:Protein NRDE2 homolog n=1 Tax=Priapulus caudatus TaxID=37621 RepID=A0ABM1EVQ6_PRICU|nr:PREDICTED: protein NRDE2 homolog [Priapulus caudatus]